MIFSAQKQRESQEWRTETMSESSSNSHYFQQRVPLSFNLRFPSAEETILLIRQSR